MWDRVRGWLENPILVKHLRSRLRKQSIFSSLAVLVLLNLCLVYAGYKLGWYQSGAVAAWILGMQVVVLAIMGSGQVNGSVGGARVSGILDFHRVSPLRPTELTLGFFFGAPIREYVLFAATLPFTTLCMGFGVPSFRGFVQLMIFLITTSWTLHAFVLLNALTSKAKTPSGAVVGILVFVMYIVFGVFMGPMSSVNIFEGERRLDFFGISLPWLPVLLLYQLPILFFLMLACTRKMESQRLHPLSKPQAIAAMATFATLVLGGIWRREDYQAYALAALYLLAVPAIMLTLMITPTQAQYAKGLFRARKYGRTRLPWWDDLSVNWVGLVILAVVVLVAGTLAGSVAAGPSDSWANGRPNGPYPLALAAAVLTVAYFGLALQYFQLRHGGRGAMYFGLFLFVVWLLPLLAGSIQSAAYSGPGSGREAYPIFALSPVAGIGMIDAIGDEPIAYTVQAAAMTPILLFTFVFNYLLVGARRRVMRWVFTATSEKEAAPIATSPAEPVAPAVRD
jgi:hypothetical protein